MSSNSIQQNTAKIPKLRFPGFDGVWEEKKLGDISDFSKDRITVSDLNENNFIGVDNLLPNLGGKTESQYIPKTGKVAKFIAGDILHSNIRPYLKKAWQANATGGASADVLIIRPNSNIESNFLYRQITSNTYFDYVMSGAKGVKMPRGDKQHIMNFELAVPPLPEQQKIASFLGSADEWLENLREQKKSLQEYKRGMMQKIFSQEIRFKDEEGNDFVGWEEKKLGSICSIKKGSQLNRDGLSIDTGHPVINGGIEPSGYTDAWNTKENTITISEGGNSCGYVNLIKEYFWCGGHCYSLLNLKDSMDDHFLYQYLKMNQHNIMRLRVGSGLPNIQKKDIEKLKLQIPSLPEQQKIAEFLSSIDQLLESKQQQITEAEEWKRGLMQGLFV